MINGCGSLFSAIAAVLCDPDGKSPYGQNLYSVQVPCVHHNTHIDTFIDLIQSWGA